MVLQAATAVLVVVAILVGIQDPHISLGESRAAQRTAACRLFLGPGFRLGARWNRLGETVKTRKKREKTG